MEEDLVCHILDLAWASGDGAEAAGRSRGNSVIPCSRREKRRACTGRARKKTVLYERERKGKRKK
jgi:hypothetical protein